MISALIANVSPQAPVLIAGPTASGKSALALAIAEAQGGVIVNADASQVYECWRVITARPSVEEEMRAPHSLFGHLAYDTPYSAGDWLRDLLPLLNGDMRPIIVGGTGLYFAALTEGLANIPATPSETRAQADALSLDDLLAGVDPATRAGIDQANRARVQRAWEVEAATGRPLHLWQQETAPPVLDASQAACFCLDAPKDWLTPRIVQRFSRMLADGGLEEARAMQSRFDPALQSCKAIGVHEAMAVINGQMTQADAIEAASIATRQYAKRQRTWFRRHMQDWQWLDAAAFSDAAKST